MIQKNLSYNPVRLKLLVSAILGALFGYTMVLTFVPSPQADAWIHLPCKHWGEGATSISVPFEWGPNLTLPGTAWRDAWETADIDWQQANTDKDVILYRSVNHSDKIDSVWNDEVTWYGQTNFVCDPGDGTWISWDSFNNTYTTAAWVANKRRSVAGHEFGHILGLHHFHNPDSNDDDPPTPYQAIMNSSRDRSQIYMPKSDDIDGVDAYYP